MTLTMNNTLDTCAVILAAGRGRRLGRTDAPKVLLQFDNETLLDRHLRILEQNGISKVHIVIGFEGHLILQAILPYLGRMSISLIPAIWSGRGSLISLCAAELSRLDYSSLILMDGDVLYHPEILAKLISAPADNSVLLDRNGDDSDEPVKLCISAGKIVDFDKRPTSYGDYFGESVGFFKLSRRTFRALGDIAQEMATSLPETTEYEAALKKILLSGEYEFTVSEVTGLPWIEIDFPDDYTTARNIYDLNNLSLRS